MNIPIDFENIVLENSYNWGWKINENEIDDNKLDNWKRKTLSAAIWFTFFQSFIFVAHIIFVVVAIGLYVVEC